MDVKTIVKEKGYTLSEVADALGISRITLYQTLDRNPTQKTLQNIANVIGCKVGDFYRDEITMPVNPHVCPHCGKPLNIKIE